MIVSDQRIEDRVCCPADPDQSPRSLRVTESGAEHTQSCRDRGSLSAGGHAVTSAPSDRVDRCRAHEADGRTPEARRRVRACDGGRGYGADACTGASSERVDDHHSGPATAASGR